MDLIEEVIEKEWEQFQLVNNEGGRACCQDNWPEFHIMRKAQFLLWPQEILASYDADLRAAKECGRNLLFEKYAFMMQDTAPDKFLAVEHALPVITEERRRRIGETVKIQLEWAEEFQKKYPLFAGQGRPIHAAQACFGDTSIETYSRGELCSYGEETEKMYAAFVKQCRREGKNLAYLTRENIAHLHGFASLEAVEDSLRARRR